MNLIKKLLFLFDRRDKFRLFILMAMMVVGASLEVVGAGIIAPFVGIIATPEIVEKYKLLSRFHVMTGSQSHYQFIITCGVVLIVFFVLKSVFGAILIYFQNNFTFRKYVSISRRLLDVYLSQPYDFHLEHNSAELYKNINQAGVIFQNAILIPVLTVVTEVLVVCFMTVMLIFLEPVIAVVSLAFLGSITFLFYSLIRKNIKRMGLDQQTYNEAMIKWVNQSLGGIKETKILGREEFFLDAYTENLQGYVDTVKHSQIMGQLPRLFIETLAVVGIVFIVFIMIWSHRSAASILPSLTLLAIAAIRVMPSYTRIVSNLACLRFNESSLDIVYNDLQGLHKIERPQGAKSLVTFDRAIELKDISFRYLKSAGDVLTGVNARIEKGDSVAFIGPSGAGKTTLVDLILGLLQPSKGSISVDGIDVWTNIQGWQRSIGYVPQFIFLSDDSIRGNIAFGVPTEKIDDARVWDALRLAQLESFVNSIPEKLDTFVGERGVRLSGGQRQRIGIARALYHNPEVLIFDEATSSLDNETEQEVTRAINNLTGQKTIILIAHRLTTAKKCKCIYKIMDGRIVTSGNYQEVVGDGASEFLNGP